MNTTVPYFQMRRQIYGYVKEQSTKQKAKREREGQGREEGRRIMINLRHWVGKFHLRTDISRDINHLHITTETGCPLKGLQNA